MNPEIQPLVENIEILNGARGSGLDRAVLLRDLVDLGLAGTVKTSGGKVRPVTGTPGTGTPGGGTSPTPDPTVEDPVAPTGVYASGGFSNILIAWDSPGYKGHAYANIYRSATDDYSQAVAISQTAANLYSDTVAVGATWYYWIRFVNKNDKEGPIQSTNGVKGTTSAAIGDILDQLKGEIDETFFTPVFNTRLDDTDKDIQQLFGDVTNIDNKFTDKFVQVEDQFVEFDGKFVDVNSIIDELKEAGEIIAEAAMSAAVGVEIESDTRRKITARIEEKQRTIITDQIAMAEDIKTVTATVDDNKAQISINNTALVELDKDTKEAVKTITERLDTQQSNIDDNKASITNQQQTLVSVQDSVNKNTGEIDATKQDVQAVTTRLDKQQSEIDDNKATITTQQQTIITIDGKVTGNADDIKDTADKVEVITQRVDTLTSEVGDNKAQISQTQQTLITIDGKVTDNEKEIGDNAKSIQVVTTRIDQQQSEIDSNKATITSQSQTIIKIDGEVQKNKADVEKAITAASNAQATADGKIDTFFQDSHPANASSGDIWFDTNDGNKQYIYHNGAWIVAQDTAIGDAILAAAGAQATADGKIETFYQPDAPTASAKGDLWVDTDDKNKLYRWSGSAWVDIQDKDIHKAIQDAASAQATADGKIDTFFQDGEPQAASEGDLWFDTDNGNKQHVYKNGAWIVAQDTAIGDAILAAATAQSTADGKITTFYVPDAPKAKAVGDLWVDTNDKNKLYRWSGSNWLDIQDGNINEIDGKVTVITERLDQLKSEVDGNTASITTNSQTIIEVNSKAEANESKINVVSQQLTTVESELGDTKSAVSTNSQTIAKMNADGTTAYEAQWGVKASVGDVQAGIGLVAKKNPDGTTTSQCTVLADQFSVGHVNTDGDDETIYPFIVTSEGVYIDTAYIKAATVQELVAGEVIADTVKASASITAPKIKGGTIEIGSNFSVDENGNATTNNIKGNNVHLTGYINATSGTFRGTVYATTGEFKGTVYATDGDFKGTVYANRIVGDVVTANTKKKSNSVGYFDRARVNKPTSKNRTLQFTVMVGLKAKGYRDQEGRFQPSTVEGRLKVTGTYGTRYSQIFSFSTNRSSEESRFFPVNVSIPIPANTTGTVNIYSEKTHSVGETSVVTSAPTTDGIWTAMLFTDGSDLS
ncbi:tail fiber protein [Vibrio phage D96a]